MDIKEFYELSTKPEVHDREFFQYTSRYTERYYISIRKNVPFHMLESLVKDFKKTKKVETKKANVKRDAKWQSPLLSKYDPNEYYKKAFEPIPACYTYKDWVKFLRVFGKKMTECFDKHLWHTPYEVIFYRSLRESDPMTFEGYLSFSYEYEGAYNHALTGGTSSLRTRLIAYKAPKGTPFIPIEMSTIYGEAKEILVKFDEPLDLKPYKTEESDGITIYHC